MDLAFEDENLRDLCLKKARAVASVGPEVAHELIKRLADLRAAESADDLLVGVTKTAWNDTEILSVSLAAGFEMHLSANHLKKPTTASGKIDWSKVTRVKVLEISRAIVQ